MWRRELQVRLNRAAQSCHHRLGPLTVPGLTLYTRAHARVRLANVFTKDLSSRIALAVSLEPLYGDANLSPG